MVIFQNLILSILLSTFGPGQDDPLKTMPKNDAGRIAKSLPGVVLGPDASVPPIVDAAEWLPLESTVYLFDHPVNKKKTLKQGHDSIHGRMPGQQLQHRHTAFP